MFNIVADKLSEVTYCFFCNMYLKAASRIVCMYY